MLLCWWICLCTVLFWWCLCWLMPICSTIGVLGVEFWAFGFALTWTSVDFSLRFWNGLCLIWRLSKDLMIIFYFILKKVWGFSGFGNCFLVSYSSSIFLMICGLVVSIADSPCQCFISICSSEICFCFLLGFVGSWIPIIILTLIACYCCKFGIYHYLFMCLISSFPWIETFCIWVWIMVSEFSLLFYG